jgi:thioredoxin:protein disulfide reductase
MTLKKFAQLVVMLPAVALLCIVAGCSSSNAPVAPTTSTATPTRKITSVGVVLAQSQNTEVSAGGKAEAVVHLSIEKGFHLNANPPSYPYLIATQLEIKPGDGVKVGKVTYPAAITAKFPFAEGPLAIYEGDKEIKAELVTDKTAAKGSQTLAAVLRIQACDDQVCYPPGTIDLKIPVTVK